jgi:uncharacterized damage-inducible protein DinB
MKAFFEDLFLYNQAMNSKMADVLIDSENSLPRRINQLASHMLLAHNTWNLRLLNKPGLSDFWSVMGLEEFILLNKETTLTSIDIIQKTDLDSICEYKNSKGVSFKNTIAEILFHIINHGNYHRGQVNLLLREQGKEPFINDYIAYKR